MQELDWATRPDLIIETGSAHGARGLSASLLAMLVYTDARPWRNARPARHGDVMLGVDIDIRRTTARHPWTTRRSHRKLQGLGGS